MKTNPRVISFRSRPSFRQLLPVIAAVFISQATAGEPAPVATDTRPFTLFMGADIAVEWNAKLYPVLYVTGSSFVIQAEGKTVKVPTDFGMSKFKIEAALRLKETSVAVTNLKNERTYTLGNDPVVRFQRGLAKAQLQYADAVYAQNLALDVQQNVANKQINTQGMDPISATFSAAEQSAAKAQQLRVATDVLNAANAGPGTRFMDQGNPLVAEGNFDALEVAFDISSEIPLKYPYVVITGRFHGPDNEPGMENNWVYARELPAIGREARKVHFTQGGFPPGYTMEDFQVHLYEHGQEIATSVAPKRMELTRDEAFQYITIEYISSHAGETLPVGPAVGRLPANFSTRVADGQLQRTYFVKVTKDGIIRGLFADEACAEKVTDPYLDSVVNELRFVPALNRGRPVDGVTAIRLTLPTS